MSSSVLKTQHTSLQFSDSRENQKQDIEKLFAKGKAFPIKTGTEAGPEQGNDNREFLKLLAREFNYRIHFAEGNWVAVDRAIAKKGSFRTGKIFVAPASAIVGRGRARVFPTLTFNHVDDRIGRIAQAAAHYPLKGQTQARANHDINVTYAEKLYRWMAAASNKGALAFVNGDFNMDDRRLDLALGRPWTTMADELQSWKNTGHGPIDALASFDRNKRVKAKKFEVLDDSKLRMNGDHYVVRGTWTVRHLKL